ncbi:hypothetical protein ACOMHN_050326 [Nucella lapillus]
MLYTIPIGNPQPPTPPPPAVGNWDGNSENFTRKQSGGKNSFIRDTGCEGLTSEVPGLQNADVRGTIPSEG